MNGEGGSLTTETEPGDAEMNESDDLTQGSNKSTDIDGLEHGDGDRSSGAASSPGSAAIDEIPQILPNLNIVSRLENELRERVEREGLRNPNEIPPHPETATFPFRLPPQRVPNWSLSDTEETQRPQSYTTSPWEPESENSSDLTPLEALQRLMELEPELEIRDQDVDNMETSSEQPDEWHPYHDYALFALRGNIAEVTWSIGTLFDFNQPPSEEFVASRLCGKRAEVHLDFLKEYLPSESRTMLRARDRAENYIYRDIDEGPLVELPEPTFHLPDYSSIDFIPPPLPESAPSNWNRRHDAIARLFLWEKRPPDELQDMLQGDFDEPLTIEFLSIRMAQSLHLNISNHELDVASQEEYHHENAGGSEGDEEELLFNPIFDQD